MKPILIRTLMSCLLILGASQTHAEQKKIFSGPDGTEYDLHYIALATTFLEPEVAKQYRIVRSKAMGMINISLIQRSPGELFGSAVPMFVKAKATNELQQHQFLNFKEVREGKSIYYIAQVQFSEGKFLRFDFEIYPEGTNQNLVHRFSHAFYND